MWDVIVIGGGPAGMMAAGRVAERGKKVLLLEKHSTLGKKLLITGGGRCNITNNKPDAHVMLPHYKTGGKFLASTFAQFGVAETIHFFRERGLEMKEENDGRLFPVSNTAQSVWDVLLHYIKEGGVEVRTRANVSSIRIEDGIVIVGFGDTEVRASACVVATGGTSHPETGSTGEGFRWLAKLGHTIIENDMALVPIRLHDTWVKKAAGVALSNIKLTTYKDDVKQKVYKGKLLFTHVGISGPTVLNMSREVGELLQEMVREVRIMLDLFPTLDHGALRERLQTLLVEHSNKKLKNVLSALVPPALVEPLLSLAKIDGETSTHSVRTDERKTLVALLKSVPLHVSGLLGKDKAIVSSGGVALTEVDFKTMRSLIAPHVFLVGDVLNIDRPSGGYSLQLCWTTGYVAGSNCGA